MVDACSVVDRLCVFVFIAAGMCFAVGLMPPPLQGGGWCVVLDH